MWNLILLLLILLWAATTMVSAFIMIIGLLCWKTLDYDDRCRVLPFAMYVGLQMMTIIMVVLS